MTTVLFKLSNVSLTIPGINKQVLSEISFDIQAGDFIILLGSNGSGKSTLLKLLDARLECSSGQLFYENNSIKKYSSQSLAPRIKLLTQNCNESLFPSLTIFENYLLVKQQYHPSIFSMKEKLDREFLSQYLSNFNEKLAINLNQCVEKLSGGEKQALALALIMLYPPNCLLLDEHTSALDPKTAEHLMALTAALIQKHKITCVLTTHDLSIAAQYGNKIISLKNGQLFKKINKCETYRMEQDKILNECY